MYRPYSCLLIIVLLGGCAGIDGDRLSKASSDVLKRTGQVMKQLVSGPEGDPYKLEREALFDQPYIDPLTDYLAQHDDDPQRAEVLQLIRQERDRRCNIIAQKYASRPATETMLGRYRSGYDYSCPKQVAAFGERVSRQPPEQEMHTAPTDTDAIANTVMEEPTEISDQVLSNCYLLTTIRNYSAAREACRTPANNGDVRSQTNMAIIAHAYEDYARAREWARKAAPTSGKAAFLLGQMYAAGRGVSQDLEQAVHWYTEAARQGHKEAQAALDRYPQLLPAGDT